MKRGLGIKKNLLVLVAVALISLAVGLRLRAQSPVPYPDQTHLCVAPLAGDIETRAITIAGAAVTGNFWA